MKNLLAMKRLCVLLVVLLMPLSAWGAFNQGSGGGGGSVDISAVTGLGTNVLSPLQTQAGIVGGLPTIGSMTNGNCVQWGSLGQLLDAGAACGSGSGGSGTVSAGVAGNLARYSASGTTVSGLTLGSGILAALQVPADTTGTLAILGVTAPTSGNCAQFGAGGVLASASAACGSGAVSTGTAGQLAQYASSGATVSGLSLGGGVLPALQAGRFLGPGWVSAAANFNASGLNSTGVGSITSGSPTLTLSFVLPGLENGKTVTVAGAGAAGATLSAIVSSGAGTLTLTLSANASTTVTNATVATVGSITSGSHTLTMTSTAGWQVGFSADVAGAGAAGVDLITPVTALTSTTLTLSAAASTTVTNAIVNFDDTAAINAALASQNNVHLDVGQYNVTGELEIAFPQWFQCDGAVVRNMRGVSTIANSANGGSIIWNRGKTNNVINMTSQQSHLADCAIAQANDITPTAGYGLQFGSGSSTLLYNGWIERNFVWNTFRLLNVNQGVLNWSVMNNIFDSFTFTNLELVTLNNPEPAGDIRWIGNSFEIFGSGNLVGVDFVDTDTGIWIWNDFNGCAPCLDFENALSQRQHFIANSFEGNGNASDVLINAGNFLTFTGNEFEQPGGFTAFSIAGAADFITISGNNASTSRLILNTSSGTHMNFSGNTDDGTGNTIERITPSLYVVGNSTMESGCIGIGQLAAVAPCQLAGLDSLLVGGDLQSISAITDPFGNFTEAMFEGTTSFGGVQEGIGMISGDPLYWSNDAVGIGSGTADVSVSRAGPQTVQFGDGVTNGGVNDKGSAIATSITLVPVPIASLFPCNSGSRGTFQVVNNGIAAPAYNAAVSATGTSVRPVFCDGTGFTYH